jgi:hypothetical protein
MARRDVHVVNHGSLYLFHLLTARAEQWVTENVSEDATRFGNALVVEHRYAQDLAEGMFAAGLGVAS